MRRASWLVAVIVSLFMPGCSNGGGSSDGGSGGNGGQGGSGAGGGSGGSSANGGGSSGCEEADCVDACGNFVRGECVGGLYTCPDGSGCACGGLSGATCNSVTYCDFPDDAMCGAADLSGACQPRPEACQEDCPGVCGCDGQFYCNSCIAAQAGIDVDPNGTCAP